MPHPALAARTSADLERIVEAATGPAGFMEMAHFDIGEVVRPDGELPRTL
jgi:hypothetical protein